METRFLTKLRNAWVVLIGRAHVFAWAAESDIAARVAYALHILEIPMAVIDDMNAAFAAYDVKVAAAEAAVAPLQAQVTDLQGQLDAIDAAAVAKTAALAATA